MTFHAFASYLSRIEETSSRNEITVILAELLNKLEANEIEATCWLLLGRILPPYEGLEFQFADKMMMRATALAYEEELESVQAEYKKIGDLAAVVQHSSGEKTHESKKSIQEIYSELTALAHENGEGSQERKVIRVVDLLKELDSVSVKYVVRIILTKLRLGFSDMTILDALSWAKMGDKSQRKLLEDTYQLKNDIGKLAKAYLLHGEKGLEHFDIELGIPLQPALCQRLKTAAEMIEKMTKVFAEPKYDGTRVQIHINGKGKDWTVRTFTRSMEESSAQFPELLAAIKGFSHSLILDCEAVGFDPKTGKLLPFQETIQRKRKHDVAEFAKNIPLKFFVFDVLYQDGESLLRLPLFERKEILAKLLQKADEMFIVSPFIVTESADELRAFHTEQLAKGLEGAVIKQYDSVYQPGRRGWSWVKFKEAEGTAAKLSDTIDAVVMGYWYGKGKRNKFGVGAFLIGVANGEQIVTLSKVGTGLSDDQWREFKTRCESVVTAEKPKQYVVDKLLIPDVWVDPQIVVEVAGDELTKSPNHSAGLALRFPRLERFRDDKKVEQITTVKELASIA
ncbi:MAG: ATP-dependent DNA ligase [Candidatus Woesebacteria bacterium]